MIRRIILLFSILLLQFSCRESFEAEGKFDGGNLLVIEGFINVGPGVTQIKLSRVVGLNQGSELVSEANANVFIEDDSGNEYKLTNMRRGLFNSDELNLTLQHSYRLRVETEGKIYLSAYTEPVVSPLIDSVSWERDREDYINLYVNTHDPANRTLYYKWEYEEVWEARSTYQSRWAYENGAGRVRTADETKEMSYCWPYHYNSDLLIATTANLQSDAIKLFPLVRFYITSPRLGWRYSMRVQQRALTEEEFEFLQIMKKNSNDLGSFFDSQPSQLFGNITCTTSDETVVGYIGAYTSNSRQLILKRSIISDFAYTTPCGDEAAGALFTDPLFQDYLRFWIPLEPIYGPFEDDAAPIIGFTLGRSYCTDCRIQSGTAAKPDFWVAEDQEPVE